ncbi:MAG: hypothetical protein EVJ47_03820 [Candidatus Acidulodesulfobacterium ferriphilum]|uniref:DUF2946 domain-containing protein n=1 Tax=Candidatus Acidulodesulfobacterium ferriphilum TaxID=2597223 RepID=A0A519BDR1_9DELT|nr:MAG: hypothetical protein EVJ47_03820 [Candidatus Acidulodesulfobacterium ferriphilum]
MKIQILLNKKYKFFLFFPLAAIAVFSLIGAPEISSMFNAPMIMSPMQAGMSMNTMQAGQAAGKLVQGVQKASPLTFFKTVSPNSNELNLQSYVTCVECQNLPTTYYPVSFYYGSFVKTISSPGKSYIKHFSSDIPHPPQNSLTLFS